MRNMENCSISISRMITFLSHHMKYVIQFILKLKISLPPFKCHFQHLIMGSPLFHRLIFLGEMSFQGINLLFILVGYKVAHQSSRILTGIWNRHICSHIKEYSIKETERCEQSSAASENVSGSKLE